MTTYAICFDFPELEIPLFAGKAEGALGFASSLATALSFADEGAAERTLLNGYGPAARAWGTVVEVFA